MKPLWGYEYIFPTIWVLVSSAHNNLAPVVTQWECKMLSYPQASHRNMDTNVKPAETENSWKRVKAEHYGTCNYRAISLG